MAWGRRPLSESERLQPQRESQLLLASCSWKPVKRLPQLREGGRRWAGRHESYGNRRRRRNLPGRENGGEEMKTSKEKRRRRSKISVKNVIWKRKKRKSEEETIISRERKKKRREINQSKSGRRKYGMLVIQRAGISSGCRKLSWRNQAKHGKEISLYMKERRLYLYLYKHCRRQRAVRERKLSELQPATCCEEKAVPQMEEEGRLLQLFSDLSAER